MSSPRIDSPGKAIWCTASMRRPRSGLQSCGRKAILKLPTGRALDRPEPRLQEAWDDDLVRGSRCRDRQVWGEHKSAAPRRIHGCMDKVSCAFPDRDFTSCWIISIPPRRTSFGSRSIPECTSISPQRGFPANQIETWFSILQGQSLSGASFTAVCQLQEHIDAFISAWNEKAEPFVWIKKGPPRRFKGRRITQLRFPGTASARSSAAFSDKQKEAGRFAS